MPAEIDWRPTAAERAELESERIYRFGYPNASHGPPPPQKHVRVTSGCPTGAACLGCDKLSPVKAEEIWAFLFNPSKARQARPALPTSAIAGAYGG